MIKEIWTIIIFDGGNNTLSFTIQKDSDVFNSDDIIVCLQLPEDTCRYLPTYAQLVAMLNSIWYTLSTTYLEKFVRKGIRKEWSYLYDAFI